MTAEVAVSASTSMPFQGSTRPGAQPLALPPASASRRLRGVARWAFGLEGFLGVGAIVGGGLFIAAPDGHLLGMTVKTLGTTPFHSYLVPGILLFTFIGLGPLVAAAITARQIGMAPLAAIAVGLTLMGWITVEMVMLAGITSLLWAFYLALGTALAALGLAWRLPSQPPRPIPDGPA